MHYVPEHIKANPDRYFAEAWPFYKISGLGNLDIGSSTMSAFNRLVSCATNEDLEARRDYLLADYGILLHQIEKMDLEKIEVINTYQRDRSLPNKIKMEHRLKSLRPARRMKMEAFDHVLTMLTLICHHLVSVRAGDANPIEDEVVPE